MQLETASAAAQAAAVRSGEVSAEELTTRILERLPGRDRAWNSLLRLTPERAMQAARAVDARRAAGQDPGPLAGVPVALKDNLTLAGTPTTCASRILEGHTPVYDCTAAVRLLAAGAVPVAKTNLDEFAMGSSTETGVAGPCRNPWDPSRVAGGSSGGSAVAVAARLVPLALGSDTGGSIRLPAAFCGVLGLKPSYGAVSRYGLVAFASSLDQVGPFARSAEDLALALEALVGRDPRDATSVAHPAPGGFRAALDGDLEGLRLGLVREWLGEGLEAGVRGRVEAAVATLREAGAEVREVSLSLAAFAVPTYYVIACAEASSNLARYDGVRYGWRAEGEAEVQAMFRATRARGFGAEVKRRILLGTFVLSSGYQEAWYGKALAVRTRIQRQLLAALEEVDCLVGPTCPTVAFPRGARQDDPLAMYLTDVCTVSANLAGLPALSLPCGTSPGAPGGPELPVGLQLVGRPFEEATLLRAAAGFGRRTGYHDQAPEVIRG